MATKSVGSKFTKIRSVTLPLLKVEKNTERGFFFHGPMYLGEKVDPKKDPATLAHVFDVETGAEGVLICPAVMQSELLRNYDAAGYVGKCFSVTMTRIPEKNYNMVTLDEIAAPDDFERPKSPPNVGGPGAVDAVVKAYAAGKAKKEAAAAEAAKSSKK